MSKVCTWSFSDNGTTSVAIQQKLASVQPPYEQKIHSKLDSHKFVPPLAAFWKICPTQDFLFQADNNWHCWQQQWQKWHSNTNSSKNWLSSQIHILPISIPQNLLPVLMVFSLDSFTSLAFNLNFLSYVLASIRQMNTFKKGIAYTVYRFSLTFYTLSSWLTEVETFSSKLGAVQGILWPKLETHTKTSNRKYLGK